MDIIDVIRYAIILIIVVYLGIVIFIDLVKTLWQLSPLTSIGFVISVFIAIWKGHISIEKLEDNISILLLIFVGTVISYVASSMIPNMLNVAFGGDLISAAIMGVVILIIWLRGREIKNMSPK